MREKEKKIRRKSNQLANREHHEHIPFGSQRKKGKKLEPIVNKAAARRDNKIKNFNWNDSDETLDY